jgi:uncharacterized protein YbcI
MTSTDEVLPTPGRMQLEIANAVVGLMHRRTGRGPTRARTIMVDDLVVVVLADSLLKAEKSLVEADRAHVVLDLRRTFQETMREELTEAVESLTGRKVRAFMSANHIEPDLAAEIFVMEPVNGDG